MLGDSALWLAMGIWVKQLTGSSAAAGLTWLAFMLPQLAGPLAGLLADRVRRRPLLVAVNLLAAASVLPLLAVHDRGDVWLIYAVMGAYGAANAVIGAAQPALLRTLVPDALFPDANGTLQTVREGLRLVAPVAGAGLFAAAGAAPVIALDVLSFLAAAAALAALRLREPAPVPAEHHPLAEAAAGLRHLRATPLLRRLLAACFVAVIAFGFCESALFAVVDAGLHRPPPFVGVLMAVRGAAAIGAGAVAALACPLLATSTVGVVLAGTALMGCGIPWTMVGLNTLLQRLTPLALQGRVHGAVDMLVAVPQVASIAGGAALIAALDHRLVLGAMAVLLAAGTLPLLSGPARSRRGTRARATARPGPHPSPAPRTAR